MYVVEIDARKLTNKAYDKYQDDYYYKHATNNGAFSTVHPDAPKLKTKKQFMRLKDTEKMVLQELKDMGIEIKEETFYSPNNNKIIFSLHEDRQDAIKITNSLWGKGLDALYVNDYNLVEKTKQRLEATKSKNSSFELER
ncbi:hypothetical protein [Siminovitchia fortis]|uniref:Uncharacterized protein n=1 Tax=Siminovitchia sediminis TaxID=1274353 RepID=A0ABW4KAM5_9BACI|nr:hypothetical protein [Siminovitchia fortis]